MYKLVMFELQRIWCCFNSYEIVEAFLRTNQKHKLYSQYNMYYIHYSGKGVYLFFFLLNCIENRKINTIYYNKKILYTLF